MPPALGRSGLSPRPSTMGWGISLRKRYEDHHHVWLIASVPGTPLNLWCLTLGCEHLTGDCFGHIDHSWYRVDWVVGCKLKSDLTVFSRSYKLPLGGVRVSRGS